VIVTAHLGHRREPATVPAPVGDVGVDHGSPDVALDVVAVADGRPALVDLGERGLDRLLGGVLRAGGQVGEPEQSGQPGRHPLVELQVPHHDIHAQLTPWGWRMLQRHRELFVAFSVNGV